MQKVKKLVNIMFSRLFVVAVMMFFQIALFVTAVYYFSQQYFYFYIACHVLSIVVVLVMISRHENPAFKITWIIAIMMFPVVGGVFYLFLARRSMPAKLKRQMQEAHLAVHRWLRRGEIKPSDPHNMLQCEYIQRLTGYPLCENTSSEYFELGEAMFKKMLEELKKAQHYIFMEYFIISPGIMFDAILEVLKEKIANGVKVYLMYDDIGSIGTISRQHNAMMSAAGIKVCVFNSFKPHMSTLLNHRDHRKITVIDGKVAFCGGINIADEYINRHDRFGHWKDTGVMLKGEAVRSFVLMFLQQWQFAMQESMEVEEFLIDCEPQPSDGKILVFGDSPLDPYNITETAYINAIHLARQYIYITTPYLVIDYSMIQALCNAALSGVDVRIYTPCRYDKWYVHMITRSNYPQLIHSGVKIFEYTPGFMHGKMLVSDDSTCMVGTCNMDFRSFHLHFECSVLMYDCSVGQAVKADMLDCQEHSHEISLEEAEKVSLWERVLRAFLRLFAPMM